MVISQDNTQSFVPNKKPRFIIMGTMVAICARTLNDVEPAEETFYYHNNRNHFWRVMQNLLQPNAPVVNSMTIKEKKAFLNKHRVMITNLVHEIVVPNSEAHDPSDTILFKAQKKGRVKFRSLDSKTKKILLDTPKFFTCRYKKGISDLMEGYLETNNLPLNMKENVWYLPTPTRCNPKARSLMWRDEMNAFDKKLKL